MGLIARVLSFLRDSSEGDNYSEVKIDPDGTPTDSGEEGPNLTGELFGPGGTDAPPLPQDYAVAVGVPGTGRVAIVGFLDPKNAGIAEGGEWRVYGRDAAGNPNGSEIYLKRDGSVVLSNQFGSVEISPLGIVTANGLDLNSHVHNFVGVPAGSPGITQGPISPPAP